MKFTTQTMLDNAAVASQDKRIMEEPTTRGAILRSIGQWLKHNDGLTASELLYILKRDEEYDL